MNLVRYEVSQGFTEDTWAVRKITQYEGGGYSSHEFTADNKEEAESVKKYLESKLGDETWHIEKEEKSTGLQIHPADKRLADVVIKINDDLHSIGDVKEGSYLFGVKTAYHWVLDLLSKEEA